MSETFNNFAEPPGVFIDEEIKARGWSQRDLAYILGYTEQTVSKLVSGKSGISAEMAKALADAFGTSAELWSNLQSAYDLEQAREPDPSIKSRARLQEAFPIREMLHRGWLAETDQSLLETQIMRFFEADSIDEVPRVQFAAAAKRSKYENDPPDQIAWLFRVRQIAREIKAPKFSKDKLRAGLMELRKLTVDPSDVRHVPSILRECGVRFVVAESLPCTQQSKIDGVCTWLDDDSPVIGLTTYHDRMDNFWFVLRHECEHVLNGDGKKKENFDDLDGPGGSIENDIANEERVANLAALEFCFPREKLLSFYNRKRPYISERDVLGFAALMEVHPAIPIGQIRYLKQDYRWLSKYLVKVRRHLLDAAVYDGWGQVAETSL